MKKLLTILGAVMMTAAGLKAQYALTGQTAATNVELVACGLPDTIQFTLTNTSGATITNDSIHIVLPAGALLHSVLPGAGYTATPKGIFIASMANSAGIVVRYLLTTNCASSSFTTLKPSYVRTNTPAQSLQAIEYLSSLAFPVLQLTGANLDTAGAGQGNVYTRRYTLTNSSADGRSYLQSISFRNILQKGLVLEQLRIGSTVVTPTISGDTVSYTFSNTELDADSRLNAGQSVVVHERVRVANICQLVNTQTSNIRTTWGCSNAFCETKTATATAQKGSFAPYIFYRGAQRVGTIQKCATFDTFEYRYFNNGNATAYDILGGSGTYGGDGKALKSEMLAESLVSFDGGLTFQNTRTSSRIKANPRGAIPASHAAFSMITAGIYPPSPDSITTSNYFTIDSLNPGDTVRVRVLLRRLCPANMSIACGYNDQIGNNKDYVSNWSWQIREVNYKDFCGNNLYDDWAPGGAPSFANGTVEALWQITSYNQPSDVSAGNVFTASLTNASSWIVFGSNQYTDSNMYYMVEMTLPASIQPVAGATKADFTHTSSSGGVSHGACDSFTYNAGTGQLRIFFYRNKWEGQRFLRAGTIAARLQAVCGGGTGSQYADIKYRGYYFLGCGSCGENQASCVYTRPIQIHCPVAEPTGGIFFNHFDYYRTQMGAADYNNDGFPDGTGPALRDSVSDRRVIPGDTIEFSMGGRVYNVTPGQYAFGYAYNTFLKTDTIRNWGDLRAIEATLYIRDLAAGLTYSMPISATRTLSNRQDSMFFRYDFSQDSIRGKGTVPSTYNFKNNDSIYIKARYRFHDNPEHPSVFYALVPFDLNNQLYLSGVANTNAYRVSDTANVESNDQWLGKVEHVFVYAGYRYTAWIYRTVCNTYNERTATWGMIGGSSAWNTSNFRNEIRPYATFRNVYKRINAGWELDTAATEGVQFFRASGYPGGTFIATQGVHYTYNAATREVNVDMRKVLDDMYAPGFLFDEARAHEINFRIKKCAPTLANPRATTGELGVDSLNMDYIYPDIPLTGTGNQTLSNGFTIINTGANNTNLRAQGTYTHDYEPKINVQVVGSSTIVSKTATTFATVKILNERDDVTFAADAQATWLKISKRNGTPIEVDSIQDMTTSAWIKPDSIGVFRTAALAVLANRDYRLAIRFNGCVDNDSIQVRTSWNCNCASPRDTGVAQGWTTLRFQRQKPQLEIINAVTPSVGIKLCDTVNISSIVNNAGSGRAYGVKYSFQMPNGGVGIAPVAGQFRLHFPANSGSFVSLPAPTHNGSGLYTWDTITKYIANLDTGGLRDFSDTAQSKFRLTFRIITSCGFSSGEDLRMFASELCGPPVEDKATLPLKLSVEDKVATNLYSINSNIPATLKGCNNSLSITTVFTNLATSLVTTGVSDSITIILPKGFEHVSTTPAPRRDTTFDGKVRLKWGVSGVAPGGTRTFNTTLSYVPNKVACGNSIFDLRSTTRFTDTCIIDGSLCSVEINKDRKEIATDVKKPIFTISAATVTSVVNPMNSAQEAITVNYTVTNSGDTSASHTMRVYHDANGDGMFNTGEPLLTSQPRTATIAIGGTHTHSFTFNAPAGTTCPLVLVMDTMTTCMCDARVSRAVSSVPYTNAGPDVTFCSGQTNPLGQVGPGTYLYSWFPNTGVANPSAASTTVTRTNTSTSMDSVHQYILTTTRTGGGCISVDTVNVTVRRLPVVTKSNDTLICNGASVTLNATGGGTYAWSTIPVKTTASITETPTANTNYTVTVTGTNTCTVSATIAVGLKAAPTANAGGPKSRVNCVGDSVQIGVAAAGGNTYAWSPATALSSTTIAQPWAKPTVNTMYRLTVTNTTTLCTAVDSAQVTVNASSLSANAGNDATVCVGAPAITIGGSPTANGGNTPYTYAWTPATGLSSTSTANPTASTATAAVNNYALMLTDGKGCIARDTVRVTVNARPAVVPSATPATVCNGASSTIAANATGGTTPYTYTWTPAGSGASHSQSPVSTTNYGVTVSDANSCTASGTVTLNVTGTSPLVANAGNARAICNGATTSLGGSPTASGGSGGFTYAWSSGAGTTANPTVSPTTTTTYTVTVTSSGCTATSSVVVTVNPKPSVAPSATPAAICNGQSSTIAANATGGTAPLTYSWSPNGAGASHSQTPAATTSYSVTVTDANMCTAAGSVTVNVTGTSPLVANAGAARTICNGASTTLGGTPTGSGGTGTFTYAWSGGAGTTANPVVSPTANTTYTVTVTSSTCTVSSTVVVTVNPKPSVAPSASLSSICNGQSVTINANAAGGTGTLTYTWNDGAGASHVKSPTANTTYLVTVSDANSCTATGSVSVTVTGSTPLAANAGSARAICNGASTSLGGVPTATGGAGGYTYAWSGGASAVANPTVSPTTTTTYTVTVTSSGCTVSSSVIVTVNPKPTIAPSATPATICNGQSTTIAANAAGGTAPLSYTWTGGGSGASFTATPTSTISYAPTVTDANGCSATGSVIVNVTGISPLVANAGTARTICSGASTSLGGVPTATGGSGGFTYAWSGGASAVANPTVSPTATTTYTVTVTSAGCTATSSVIVSVNPSPSTAPSASATTICNGQSVTINANATGGTAPLSYTWNNGAGASHVKSPTANTTYLVTVSDANSCTATGSVSVTVTGSTPLTANAGSARAICNGASTTLGGTPTATGGAGGYTYSWSGGAGTTANPVVSPTATTTYTLTVTSSGCTVSSSVVVTVNPKPSVAPGATPAAICNGQSTTIAANATNGTAPLTYVWGSGSTASSFTATPGTTTAYAVTVSDVNGCTASGSITVVVTGTSPLVAVSGSARAICSGSSTTLGGSPSASGGAGGYTYAWSGGAGNTANPVVSPTATTTYTLTVTSSGCTASNSVIVTVNPKPFVAPSTTSATICNGSSTNVNAGATGGTAPITYQWSPSGSGASFTASPTATTIFNVTATDANMCTATGGVSVNVTGSSPLTANAGTNRTICSATPTNLGSSPTGNGGNTSGTYTYSWSSSPAGFTSTAANPTVSPTATTTYTVTVTNTLCTATSTVIVTVNPRPVASPTASVNPVCSGSNTSIAANPSGGTSPYTYQWNTSQTSASFVASPTATGAPVVNAYTVTVSDVNLCTATATINVTVNPLPVVAPIANQSVCIPSSGGTVALSAAALTAGQTGAWSTITSPSGAVSFTAATSATTNVNTLSPINTYTFRWTITQSGCSNWTNTNVTVNESPVIEAGANDTICLNTSKALSASLTSVSPAAINWKANSISSTPFAFTTGVTVAPTTTTRYIFTAAISPCIVSDTVVVAVIGVPNLVDDLATCLSATEDIATTFNIPTTIGSNDALGLVLRGGVTYKVLSSKNSTATVSGTTLNYASNLNFYGKDTVVIEAYSNECTPLRDTAMFCVDVAGVNDKPVLAPDTVKAVGTNPKTFNPLANDSDIETTLKGGNITVLSGPNSGTLTGPAADGTFTYTGNSSNLATLDTIVYQVCDSGLPMPAQCDTSRIIVQLVPEIKDSTAVATPGNPVVLGPAVTTGPGVTMTPKLIGVDGTNGTTITTPSGTATIDPTTGVMTFTPNDTPFIGNDTVRKVLCFTYPDGSEACDTSIFVVSNPSVTNTSSDSTPMNTPKVVGTLKPYKFEGGVATTTTTPNATVDPVTGAVTYTPKPGFVGVDTVKVTRCDSKGNCVTDLFIMTVTPSLPDTSVTAIGTTPINLGPAIVGGNGTTVETTIVGPSNGTVTKNADGTITYVPSGSYVGRDTITRIVKVTYPDGTVKYDTQTVVVKNTIPDVINPDGDIIVKQDETKDIGTLPKITFEGSPVTTTITSSAGGTATVDSNGKVTYKPKPGFFGTDTIKIVRCDNLGNCVTSIFIVKVEEVVSDIANYFSPNGDGINDVWNLDGLLGRYPNAKAIIYNRWGNVVWRSTGPYGRSTSGTNVWFGQAEGSQDNVPDGVYYYLLELEDDFKTTKTGFIEVMRQ
jgi:gliding motility-associated-like protein